MLKPKSAAKTNIVVSMLALMLLAVGCATPKLNNADRLIERHPVGFRDAVSASDAAAEFVRDTLKTLADVEAIVERGD